MTWHLWPLAVVSILIGALDTVFILYTVGWLGWRGIGFLRNPNVEAWTDDGGFFSQAVKA